MKAKWWVISVVVFLALLIGGLYTYFVLPYMPKYKWYKSFDIKSDQPYGLKFFYQDLESSSSAGVKVIAKDISSQLPLDGESKSAYIFVGQKYSPDTAGVKQLIKFVNNGNSALICSQELPLLLLEQMMNSRIILEYEPISKFDDDEIVDFVPQEDENQFVNEIVLKNQSTIYDSVVEIHFMDTVNFREPTIFHHRYYKDTVSAEWTYYPGEIAGVLATYAGYRTISKINDSLINSFKIRVGTGYFVFNSSPELFTNIHYVKPDGYKNASAILGNLVDGPLYWDEGSKSYSIDNRSRSEQDFNPSRNPLRYVYSQPSLTYSFYTVMALVILFVIFGMKRRQKAIPILEANRNSTLDYVNALTALYKQSKDHSYIAREMLKIFANFIKVKYGVVINIKDQETSLIELSVKSGVGENFIKQLVSRSNIACFGGGENPQNVVEFQESLNYFYKNCK